MAHAAAEVYFPDDVMRVLLRALPADARGRACCVCRRWRDILACGSLWAELDISPAGGVPRRLATLALMTGAAAHARGMLTSLNLHGCAHLMGDAMRDLLMAAPALRTLTLPDPTWLVRSWVDGQLQLHWHSARFEPVRSMELNDAQQVTQLHLHTLCVRDEFSTAVLRNEAQLAPLRVQRLRVDCRHVLDNARRAFFEALNDVEAHPSLTALDIRFGVPHLLPALVDAVNARQLRALSLNLHPDGVPELARLLRSCPTLRSLCLTGTDAHWDAGGVPALAPHLAELGAALLEAPALTGLGLCNINLFVGSTAATTLLGCISRHPGLRALAIDGNELPLFQGEGRRATHYQRRTTALAALSALLAEGAPALRSVRLSRCWVDEDALATLLAALARRPAPLQLLDLRENTRRLAGALLAAAPPNAVHVEVSVDEEKQRAREADFGLYAMDTPGLLAAPDVVAGALEYMHFTDAVDALDAVVAAADGAPNA